MQFATYMAGYVMKVLVLHQGYMFPQVADPWFIPDEDDMQK